MTVSRRTSSKLSPAELGLAVLLALGEAVDGACSTLLLIPDGDRIFLIVESLYGRL